MVHKPKVTRLKITDLKTDPSNANEGTERGLRALDDSLAEVGLGRSIVTDRNGYVIGGNKTTERAVDRGFEDAIVVHTTGDELVVVQRDDLDLLEDDPSNRARKLAYYDNRVGELDLKWSPEQLETDRLAGVDIVEKLWTPVELEEIRQGMEQSNAPDDQGAQIDKAAELQEKWQVQRGQVWLIESKTGSGEHRIMCGDSTDEVGVERLMDGVRADVVVTDPPYDLDISQGDKGIFGKGAKAYRKLTGKGLNELVNSIDYGITISIVKEVKNLFVFCSNNQIPELMNTLVNFGYIPTLLVWNKYNSIPFSHSTWRQDAEFIVHGRKPGAVFEGDAELKRKISTFPNNPSKYGHPTEKPIELIVKYLKISTLKAHCVYDPFLGSGTVISACENIGRIGYGMEISEPYTAVCLERLSDLGLEPRLEE